MSIQLICATIIILIAASVQASVESSWSTVLQKYKGNPALPQLKQDQSWTQLLAELSTASPTIKPKKPKVNTVTRATPKVVSSKDQELAFWLNAYNIAFLQAQLNSANIFVTVNNKAYSPAQILQSKLIPLADPRVHYALGKYQVFTAGQVQAQLNNLLNTN